MMGSPNAQTVISMDDGVQYTVMALMGGESAFGGLPNCAIFSDTHWETKD